MSISDQWRKLAIFVCSEDRRGNLIPIGTAFLVAWDLDIGGHLTYAITNRHTIEKPGRKNIYLRINTQKGAPEDILIPPARWRRHPKDDIAAAIVQLSDNRYETFPLELSRSLLNLAERDGRASYP